VCVCVCGELSIGYSIVNTRYARYIPIGPKMLMERSVTVAHTFFGAQEEPRSSLAFCMFTSKCSSLEQWNFFLTFYYFYRSKYVFS